MAVHSVCEFCGHKLSVPDKLKGKKVSCPSCGKKTRVVTALDLSIEEARRKEETSRKEKKAVELPQTAPQPQAALAKTPEKPRAAGEMITRYPALRTLRSVFTFFAYLLGVLSVAVGLVFLRNSGDAQEGLVLLLGFFIGAVVVFCVFKLLAEWARLGADLGDMESRMLELLIHMRDRLDNLGK